MSHQVYPLRHPLTCTQVAPFPYITPLPHHSSSVKCLVQTDPWLWECEPDHQPEIETCHWWGNDHHTTFPRLLSGSDQWHQLL